MNCSHCGAKLPAGARFCGVCGNTVSLSGSKPEPGHSVTSFSPLTGVTYADSRARALNVSILAFALGLILLFTGMGGRVLMSAFVGMVSEIEIFEGDEGEIAEIINAAGRREIIKLFVSLVKGDSSAFVNSMQNISGQVVKIGGDPYSIGDIFEELVGGMSEELFRELREMLIDEVGAYWRVLQIMVYYQDILHLGAIIAPISALLWYLLGGTLRRPSALMRYSLIVSTGWGVLILVASNIIGFIV